MPIDAWSLHENVSVLASLAIVPVAVSRDLDRFDAGEREEHLATVRAQLEAARRLVERDARRLLPCVEIQPDDRALLLRGDPGDAPVAAEGAVVRLGDRHLTDHAIGRGPDDERTVRAPALGEDPSPEIASPWGFASTSTGATARSALVSITLTVDAPSLLT
jgi:hypothetical protein